MASKNAPEDLLAEGFNNAQFGEPANVWATYAQPLLDKMTEKVLERVGAVNYALTSGPIYEHVKDAELFLVCEALWLRRMNRYDGDAAVSGQGGNSQSFQRFRDFADQYRRKAEAELAQCPTSSSVSESTSSAPAFGTAVSSHFE